MAYNPADDPRIDIPLEDLKPGLLLHIKIFPCSVNPFIAADMVLPALLKAFIAFEKPDPKHIIHKITGRSSLKGIRLAFEGAEILEPEVGDILDRVTSMVWKLDALLDIAIWYFFIAGLAYDTFIDWTSMVYRANGCLPDDHHLWIRSGVNACVYDKDLDWTPACEWHNCEDNYGNHVSVDSGVDVEPGQTYSIQWTSEWPVPTNMRIHNTTTDKTVSQSENFTSLFNNTNWGLVAVYDQPPPTVETKFVLQAINADDNPLISRFGSNGGYFAENYTHAFDPINVSWDGPFFRAGRDNGQ